MRALDGALRRSREHHGPALVCLRTDHDANLGIPADMVARFFEVYSGPAKPGAPPLAGEYSPSSTALGRLRTRAAD